jgi:hypothetical protein
MAVDGEDDGVGDGRVVGVGDSSLAALVGGGGDVGVGVALSDRRHTGAATFTHVMPLMAKSPAVRLRPIARKWTLTGRPPELHRKVKVAFRVSCGARMPRFSPSTELTGTLVPPSRSIEKDRVRSYS